MTPILKNSIDQTTVEYQDIFERVEQKYILTATQYDALRERLDTFMEIDQYGKTTIMNIYYDTPNYLLIRRSIEKPRYKEKIRLRSYGVPTAGSPAFIEMKKKFKKIVYKRRIAMPYAEAIGYMNEGRPVPQDSQIAREIDYVRNFYEDLEARMAICYDRIAMAGIQDPGLRITFDTDLRWRNTDLDLRSGAYGKALLEEGKVLMEAKVKNALPWDLAKIFSELQIYPASFSKYGNAYRNWMDEGGKQEMPWLAVSAAPAGTNHPEIKEHRRELATA